MLALRQFLFADCPPSHSPPNTTPSWVPVFVAYWQCDRWNDVGTNVQTGMGMCVYHTRYDAGRWC